VKNARGLVENVGAAKAAERVTVVSFGEERPSMCVVQFQTMKRREGKPKGKREGSTAVEEAEVVEVEVEVVVVLQVQQLG
jgi:hypothetical protein